MGCGCGGKRKTPDAVNAAREAKRNDRRAAVDAARRMLADGKTPTVVRK